MQLDADLAVRPVPKASFPPVGLPPARIGGIVVSSHPRGRGLLAGGLCQPGAI